MLITLTIKTDTSMGGNNFNSKILQMSKATKKSVTEIKLIVGIPFDGVLQFKNAEEARNHFLEITAGYDPGDLLKMPSEILEKALPTLEIWSHLFIFEVSQIRNKRRARAMLKKCPPNNTAEKVVIKKIAELYGVTPEKFCRLKLAEAKNLEEAITIAFRFMPVSTHIIGPKGKILFMRNSIPLNSDFTSEINIKSPDKEDQNILFSAGLRKGMDAPIIELRKASDLADWNDKW
ncbi:MAG: hypothetical protein NT165_01755 [Candidatus Falkowbacteria bacterium]|nr:hypothetical protein [Candidatus Falkowbacteria bacterium]